MKKLYLPRYFKETSLCLPLLALTSCTTFILSSDSLISGDDNIMLLQLSCAHVSGVAVVDICRNHSWDTVITNLLFPVREH